MDDPGGRLILIPTPIGNLEDLSDRIRRVLADVDVLCCEDTRTTRALLAKANIEAPALTSVHDHNERQRVGDLVRQLLDGRRVGLVSEAGTPVVSDPGFVLVRAAVEAGVRVESLPGPCAATTAIALSGLPADRFQFVGFPPRPRGKRGTWLEELSQVRATLILYESPRRIRETLELAVVAWGDRPACLAVNLSKQGERTYRGTLTDILGALDTEPRGEMTLVVGGDTSDDTEARWARADRAIASLVDGGTPVGLVRDVVADIFDLPRRQVYGRAQARKESAS